MPSPIRSLTTALKPTNCRNVEHRRHINTLLRTKILPKLVRSLKYITTHNIKTKGMPEWVTPAKQVCSYLVIVLCEIKRHNIEIGAFQLHRHTILGFTAVNQLQSRN